MKVTPSYLPVPVLQVRASSSIRSGTAPVIVNVTSVNERSQTFIQTPSLTRTPWIFSHRIRQSLSMNISSHELEKIESFQLNNIGYLSGDAVYTFLLRAAITLNDSENESKKTKILELVDRFTRLNESLILGLVGQQTNNTLSTENASANLNELLRWDFPALFDQLRQSLYNLNVARLQLSNPPSYEESISNYPTVLPPSYDEAILNNVLPPSYDEAILNDVSSSYFLPSVNDPSDPNVEPLESPSPNSEN